MNISRLKRINRRVPQEVFTREEIKLEIGCGDDDGSIKQGFIGIDIEDFGQDIVWDIEEGLPFPDDSVDQVVSKHVLEHLNEPTFLLNELHRVMKPAAKALIVVPHITHYGAYEFTHTKFFTEETFKYLNRLKKLPRYGVKPWKINNMVVNKRNEIHVNLTPIKE